MASQRDVSLFLFCIFNVSYMFFLNLWMSLLRRESFLWCKTWAASRCCGASQLQTCIGCVARVSFTFQLSENVFRRRLRQSVFGNTFEQSCVRSLALNKPFENCSEMCCLFALTFSVISSLFSKSCSVQTIWCYFASRVWFAPRNVAFCACFVL